MKSIEKKGSLLLNLFFCLIFMPALLMLGPARPWMGQWPLFFAMVCAWLYGCYFAVLRLDIPRMILTRHYLRLAAVAAVFIAVTWLLTNFPLPQVEFVTPSLSLYQTQVRNFSVTLTIWLMFTLVMGYSLALSLLKTIYRQMLLKRRIEAERDKAELELFKAQISPHFLFNTLNSLYSLVIGTSEKAENAFVKFTGLLQYTYVTIRRETVALSDEIDYIGNYIDLQLLRLNSCTDVRWTHSVDDPQMAVPPMLLITFVENAFKYGASTTRPCTIELSLHVDHGKLHFATRNRIMRHSDTYRRDIPVGIENCRARLEGLFPGHHSLVTDESNGLFTLTLTIDTNKEA